MLTRIEDELELLERHIKILNLVIQNEPIGIIKLSEISRLPQHKIRYSLRVLEQNDMIKPSQRGAVTTEKAKVFLDELSLKIDVILKKIQSLKQ
jgi:predicted transcriptional regulator